MAEITWKNPKKETGRPLPPKKPKESMRLTESKNQHWKNNIVTEFSDYLRVIASQPKDRLADWGEKTKQKTENETLLCIAWRIQTSSKRKLIDQT